MAIIHTTPQRSGTEALLKVLGNLTDEVTLTHGVILMGQFSQNKCRALKLSLYLDETNPGHMGLRNVFIEDVKDTVEVRYVDLEQAKATLKRLHQTRSWQLSFPSPQRSTYALCELDDAALAVRDYLLVGKLPREHPTVDMEEALRQLNNATGQLDFNLFTTLMNYDYL